MSFAPWLAEADLPTSERFDFDRRLGLRDEVNTPLTHALAVTS